MYAGIERSSNGSGESNPKRHIREQRADHRRRCAGELIRRNHSFESRRNRRLLFLPSALFIRYSYSSSYSASSSSSSSFRSEAPSIVCKFCLFRSSCLVILHLVHPASACVRCLPPPLLSYRRQFVFRPSGDERREGNLLAAIRLLTIRREIITRWKRTNFSFHGLYN